MNKEDILKNVKSLIDSSFNIISILSNISAYLFKKMNGVSWLGFYLYDENKNNLYLGPFQGDVACFNIPFGKGVCGKALEAKKTLIVPNVHEFEGHIACSNLTNSEIVTPIIDENRYIGVIDIDSNNFNNFNNEDRELLEIIAKELIKANIF